MVIIFSNCWWKVGRRVFAVWARSGHTDVKVPDFSYSRCNPKEKASDRRFGVGCMAAAGTALTIYGTKSVVQQLVFYMAASADVLAMASIEVKLAPIAEGSSATFKWRGKPLFIFHRTAADIERERAVDWRSLRDPQPDEERCKRPEWLVVIGVCTHLGCVPIANAGDFGGYYCPCHGSHFDGAGRARKGPAPLNLKVPDHRYLDDNTLLVG